MGYLHIQNLYKDQTILLFKECYALEKVHGTSAHITFNPSDGSIRYFSGGTAHATFVSLFNEAAIIEAFKSLALPVDKTIVVYGESYGGKEQGMSLTYGKMPKFIAFDVEIGGRWLDVPAAEAIVKTLGLEFVPYVKTSTDIRALDMLRDAPSRVAINNGISTITVLNESGDIRIDNERPREGIVLRPLKEMTLNNGNRVIAKHKGEAFRETETTRHVETDPTKLKVLADADAVATEWVTPMRLQHVLDKIPDVGMEKMPIILKAMVEDVLREGAGEIIESQAVNKAISRKTATMFKEYLQAKLMDITAQEHLAVIAPVPVSDVTAQEHLTLKFTPSQV